MNRPTYIHPLTIANERYVALDAAIAAVKAEAGARLDIALHAGYDHQLPRTPEQRILDAQVAYDAAVSDFMRATLFASKVQSTFFAAMKTLRKDVDAHGTAAFGWPHNAALYAHSTVAVAIDRAADFALGYTSS